MASRSRELPEQQPSEDTAKAVKDLMDTMQSRFQQLSERIIGRIDDMGNRIDDLEKSVSALMKESEDKAIPANTGGNLMVSPSGKLVSGVRTPIRE